MEIEVKGIMSNQYNTDGLDVFPMARDTIALNAFESIKCAFAFSVRDHLLERRSAWIYFIVFGIEDELDQEAWDECAKRHGWDDEDKKRVMFYHDQFANAEETAKRWNAQ